MRNEKSKGKGEGKGKGNEMLRRPHPNLIAVVKAIGGNPSDRRQT